MDQVRERLVAELSDATERIAARLPAVRGWDEVIHTGDGAWTRRQVLAHLASNDLRYLARVRVAAGVAGPEDHAEHEAERRRDEWNALRVGEREGEDIAALVDEMLKHRAELVALLRGLSDEQWSKPMWFRGGQAPLEEGLRHLIAHGEGHLEEIVTGAAVA